MNVETAALVLEGTLAQWAQSERTTEQNGLRSYRISHKVSEEETWDCGVVTLHPLGHFPEVLKSVLPSSVSTSTLEEHWTQCTISLHDEAAKSERNHLELVLREFISRRTPMTTIRSEGETIVPLDSSSDRALKEVTTVLRTGLPSPPPSILDLGSMPGSTDTKPALPPIPAHPLRARRERVRDLYIQGKSYKDMEQDIGESLHVVKKDLEWLRKKKLLPAR